MSEVWESGWTEKGRVTVIRNWQKSLGKVAGHLENLEDTIIQFLLNRAQFMQNNPAYENGKSGYEERDDENLLGIRLLKRETGDSEDGRYTTPEEVPFNKDLPAPKRKVKKYEFDRYSGVSLEQDNRVDISAKILSKYLIFLGIKEDDASDEKDRIEKKLCEPGDDENHGSATDKDMSCLIAIAERIHYGSMYIAECKFNMNPEEYAKLIAKKDTAGLMEKLTREPIEASILQRVWLKVEDFQKDTNPDVRSHVDPEVIVEFYKKVIIPLTKEGEVRYLLQKKIS